ncbi:MAG: hypothetical protein Q9160_005037 [Pyrenula sp. 1 TL-2023]
MRLQVTIKRHGLPQTNILWTSRSPFSHHTTTNSPATIAQLVEDINDIVPLESGEWGLEDYAVEVDGYECLHFQPIESVLREDDKVTVRALQTTDLRFRRYSGRHQVTSDGRHLIDGVPYGRPYVRNSSRPEVSIPSRKRKRSDLEDLSENDTNDAPLPATFTRNLGSHLITAVPHFGQNVDEYEEESEEDEDFVNETSITSSDEESVAEEDLVLSEQENAALKELSPPNGHREISRAPKRRKLSGSPQLAIETPAQPLLLEYGQSASPRTNDALKSAANRLPKRVSFEDGYVSGSDDSSATSSSYDSSLDTSGADSSSEGSSSNESEDESSDEGSIEGSSDEDTEDESSREDLRTKQFSEGSVDETSDDDSEDGPSHGDSSNESVDERDSRYNYTLNSPHLAGEMRNKRSGTPVSDDSATSSSMSDSMSFNSERTSSEGSDSELSDATSSSMSSLEEEKSSGSGQSVSTASSQPVHSMESKDLSNFTAPVVVKQAAKPYVPPGHGTKLTQRGNTRARKRRRLEELKAKGLLGPDAGFKELYDLDMQGEDQSHEASKSGQEQLEERKEALAAMLNEHSVENEDQQPHENQANEVMNRARSLSPSNEGQIALQSTDSLSGSATRSEPTKQRSRLDIASSRRLLFGSLGLRVPKTQSAERELREKLADEAQKRPGGAFVRRSGSATENEHDTGTQTSWMDKLDVSAVECAYEGVELSAPPFPFVQCWDDEALNEISKRKGGPRIADKKRKIEHVQSQLDDAEPSGTINTVNTAEATSADIESNGAIRDQLMRDANDIAALSPENESSNEDLPIPPAEVSNLPDLSLENAQAGSIIVYQTLEIGENFQPRMSVYRTARVDQILEDGTLGVTPAKRDLEASVPNLTGLNDSDEEAGNSTAKGSLNRLRLTDLVSPKLLVQAASSGGQSGAEGNIASPAHTGGPDDCRTTERQHISVSPVLKANSGDQGTAPQPSVTFVSTPRRQQIASMMKDAGFDSSVNSELRMPEPFISGVDEDNGSTKNNDNLGNRRMVSPHSPKTTAGATEDIPQSQPAVDDVASQSIPSPRFAGFDSSPRAPVQTNAESAESIPYLDVATQQSATPGVVHYPSLGRESSSNEVRENPPKVVDYHVGEGRTSNSPDDNHSGTVYGRSLPEVDETHLESLNPTVPPTEDATNSPPNSQASDSDRGKYRSYDGAYSSDDELPDVNKIMSTAPDPSPLVSPLPLKISRRSDRWSTKSPKFPGEEAYAGLGPKNIPNSSRSSQAPPGSQIPEGSQIVDLTISSSPVSPGDSDDEYPARQSSQNHLSGWRPQTRPIRKAGSLGKSRGGRISRVANGNGSQR